LKERAYFSAYRSQSSQVRKKAFGVPLVPLVSCTVKTSPQSTLRKRKSSFTGGWFARMVFPDMRGRERRSSCSFTEAGSIPCSRNHER